MLGAIVVASGASVVVVALSVRALCSGVGQWIRFPYVTVLPLVIPNRSASSCCKNGRASSKERYTIPGICSVVTGMGFYGLIGNGAQNTRVVVRVVRTVQKLRRVNQTRMQSATKAAVQRACIAAHHMVHKPNSLRCTNFAPHCAQIAQTVSDSKRTSGISFAATIHPNQ